MHESRLAVGPALAAELRGAQRVRFGVWRDDKRAQRLAHSTFMPALAALLERLSTGRPYYLNGGTRGTLFDIGDGLVAKVTRERMPDYPRELRGLVRQPLQRYRAGRLHVAVLPALDTHDVTLREVERLNNAIRRRGFHWEEAEPDQAGRVKTNGRLVVLDGDIVPLAHPSVTRLGGASQMRRGGGAATLR